MEKELQNIELIEKYLSGKLNDGEKASFENRLDTDEALRNDLDAYRDAMKAISDVGLKNQLKEFHQELFAPKQVFWKRPQFAVAAVILLLLAVTAVFFMRDNNMTQLFETYFEPYPDVITMRDNSKIELNEALNYYTEGDYKNAIIAFDKLDVGMQNDFTHLYNGISYLAIANTNDAAKTFNNLLESKGEVSEQARWYLLLTYLKQNKLNDAETLSESIKQGAYKYAESRKILERIKE